MDRFKLKKNKKQNNFPEINNIVQDQFGDYYFILEIIEESKDEYYAMIKKLSIKGRCLFFDRSQSHEKVYLGVYDVNKNNMKKATFKTFETEVLFENIDYI